MSLTAYNAWLTRKARGKQQALKCGHGTTGLVDISGGNREWKSPNNTSCIPNYVIEKPVQTCKSCCFIAKLWSSNTFKPLNNFLIWPWIALSFPLQIKYDWTNYLIQTNCELQHMRPLTTFWYDQFKLTIYWNPIMASSEYRGESHISIHMIWKQSQTISTVIQNSSLTLKTFWQWGISFPLVGPWCFTAFRCKQKRLDTKPRKAPRAAVDWLWMPG
jgi:hypothetical protein